MALFEGFRSKESPQKDNGYSAGEGKKIPVLRPILAITAGKIRETEELFSQLVGAIRTRTLRGHKNESPLAGFPKHT